MVTALEYLDIAVTATITRSGESETPEPITETRTVIELVVPFDFTSKRAVKVYRCHKGTAEALRQNSTREDGTYQPDEANGLIHIFANKFSTYAVSYAACYTIMFDAREGTVDTTSAQTNSEGRLESLPVPTREGYTFDGWYTESGEKVDEKVFQADTTVYARWTKKQGPDDSDPDNSDGPNKPDPDKPTPPPSYNPDPGYNPGYNPGSSIPSTPNTPSTPSANPSKPVETQPPEIVNPFTDVAESAWYYDAVMYVYEQGLMNGDGTGRFLPMDTLSRSMLAQILYNREDRPNVTGISQFPDVTAGAGTMTRLGGASQEGIVTGYDNGQFGPDDPITREQLAVMLWRYAGSPAATNKGLHFSDAGDVSDYAQEAMYWAVEHEVLHGNGSGQLEPKGQASRAEAAQMFMNLWK